MEGVQEKMGRVEKPEGWRMVDRGGWMGGSEGAVGVWQKTASSLAAKVCPSLSGG